MQAPPDENIKVRGLGSPAMPAVLAPLTLAFVLALVLALIALGGFALFELLRYLFCPAHFDLPLEEKSGGLLTSRRRSVGGARAHDWLTSSTTGPAYYGRGTRSRQRPHPMSPERPQFTRESRIPSWLKVSAAFPCSRKSVDGLSSPHNSSHLRTRPYSGACGSILGSRVLEPGQFEDGGDLGGYTSAEDYDGNPRDDLRDRDDEETHSCYSGSEKCSACRCIAYTQSSCGPGSVASSAVSGITAAPLVSQISRTSIAFRERADEYSQSSRHHVNRSQSRRVELQAAMLARRRQEEEVVRRF